jgi:hypothetical protein
MLWIRHGSITVEIIFSNLNSFFTFNWSKHNLLKYFSLNEIVLSSLLGFVYLSRAVKETCSFAELVMQFSFFSDWNLIDVSKYNSSQVVIFPLQFSSVYFFLSLHLSVFHFIHMCVAQKIPICIILKESVCPSVVKIFSD